MEMTYLRIVLAIQCNTGLALNLGVVKDLVASMSLDVT